MKHLNRGLLAKVCGSSIPNFNVNNTKNRQNMKSNRLEGLMDNMLRKEISFWKKM